MLRVCHCFSRMSSEKRNCRGGGQSGSGGCASGRPHPLRAVGVLCRFDGRFIITLIRRPRGNNHKASKTHGFPASRPALRVAGAGFRLAAGRCGALLWRRPRGPWCPRALEPCDRSRPPPGAVPVPVARHGRLRGSEGPHPEADLQPRAPARAERHRGLQEARVLRGPELGEHTEPGRPVRARREQPFRHVQLRRGRRRAEERRKCRSRRPRGAPGGLRVSSAASKGLLIKITRLNTADF